MLHISFHEAGGNGLARFLALCNGFSRILDFEGWDVESLPGDVVDEYGVIRGLDAEVMPLPSHNVVLAKGMDAPLGGQVPIRASTRAGKLAISLVIERLPDLREAQPLKAWLDREDSYLSDSLARSVQGTLGEPAFREILGEIDATYAYAGVGEFSPPLSYIAEGREAFPWDSAYLGSKLTAALDLRELAARLESCPFAVWYPHGGVFFSWSWNGLPNGALSPIQSAFVKFIQPEARRAIATTFLR